LKDEIFYFGYVPKERFTSYSAAQVTIMPSFMRIWNDDTGILRVEQPVLFQISQVYQKWGMLH
jgi:hypothetical protein